MSHYNEQREADEIWKNAPVTATHYGGGKFWRMHDSGNCWETECGFDWVHVDGSPFRYKDLSYRPQSHTKPDWSKAPEGATHYADGSFLQRTSGFDKQFLRYNEQTGLWNAKLSGNIECYPDYQERPKPHQNAQEALKQPDPVNHPKHYAIAPGVEAIDIIKASLTPEQFEGYLLGNFLKYRLRAGDKDDLQQDIAKSNWYRERLNR